MLFVVSYFCVSVGLLVVVDLCCLLYVVRGGVTYCSLLVVICSLFVCVVFACCCLVVGICRVSLWLRMFMTVHCLFFFLCGLLLLLYVVCCWCVCCLLLCALLIACCLLVVDCGCRVCAACCVLFRVCWSLSFVCCVTCVVACSYLCCVVCTCRRVRVVVVCVWLSCVICRCGLFVVGCVILFCADCYCVLFVFCLLLSGVRCLLFAACCHVVVGCLLLALSVWCFCMLRDERVAFLVVCWLLVFVVVCCFDCCHCLMTFVRCVMLWFVVVCCRCFVFVVGSSLLVFFPLLLCVARCALPVGCWLLFV